VHATARGTLRESLTLDVSYQGGWSIAPPARRPAIGDRSSAPRILSERLINGKYTVMIEGQAGTTERFWLREGDDWREVDITFPSAGASPDGYTTASLSPGAASRAAQAQQRVSQAPFGRLPDGTLVEGYTIRNGRGTSMHVITWGGIITSLRSRDRRGAFDDIVLGYDSLAGYLEESPYFGAIVGRFANRIAQGRFVLDGRTWRLPVNNGPNSLHGGTRGFDKVNWRARAFENDTAAGVVLTHTSPDGDMGYPGRLEVEVTYTLTDRDELVVDYRATTDRPTPVNLSQHSYFNLTGSARRDILEHVLHLNASRYTPVDSTLIPTGELAPVAGTPFDFRTPTAIGARIGSAHRQLRLGRGYDHNFVLDRKGTGLELAARVTEPESGRILEIFTDQPGIQFYSGNFLDGSIRGKAGRAYHHRFALVLETQHFPDSPNQPAFPSTILRPGEQYQSRTVFRFGTAP
jgi:aldose 1-epimerase